MARKRLEDLNVPDNATVVVSGKVAFSALKKPHRRVENTQFPEPKPSYKVSVVLDANNPGNAFTPGTNPDGKAMIEFLKERIYTDRNGQYVLPLKTAAFTNQKDENGQLTPITAPNLYSAAHNPASAKPTNEILQNELGQGQDIKVLVRALPQGKAGMNRTYVIDGVQVPDITNVKYFTGSTPVISIDGFNTTPDSTKPNMPSVEQAPAPQAQAMPTPQQDPAATQNTPQQPQGDIFAAPDNQNQDNNPFSGGTDTTQNDNNPF